MAAWVVWLLIGGVLFIAEMLSLTLYLLWLGIGAVAGAVAAFFMPDAVSMQVVTAAVVSLILTIFSKPISRSIRSGKGYKDALDTLTGRTAIVMQDIKGGEHGVVKVGGDLWSATADESIVQGETVVVLERRSTVLYVQRNQHR